MTNILFQYCEILCSSPHQFLRLTGKEFGHPAGMPNFNINFGKVRRNKPTTTKNSIEKMGNQKKSEV